MDARSPDMGNEADAGEHGKIGHAPHLGETADTAEIGLEDVDRPGGQRVVHRPAAVPGFAPRHGDGLGGADTGIGGQIFGHDGFFQPCKVERRGTAAEFDRLARIVAVVGVGHECHIGPDGRARGLKDAQVVLDTEADLHLDRAEAFVTVARDLGRDGVGPIGAAPAEGAGGVGLDPVAHPSAQKDGHRHAEVPALDVPERHVDAGQRRDGQPAHPLVAQEVVGLGPEHLGLERIASDEPRRIGGDNRGVGARRAKAFAPADRAVLADHLDQKVAAMIEPGRGAFEGLGQTVFQDVGADVGDLHFRQVTGNAGPCQPSGTSARLDLTAKGWRPP